MLKRRLIALSSIVVGVYLVLSVYLHTRQNDFIYFPQRAIISTPKDYHCDYEDVRIPVGGQSLHAWWIPAASATPSPVAGRSLLYFHGNGGNVGANSEHACRLSHIGFSVLIFDYRGYGRSDAPSGSLHESTLYEDGDAAWQYLTVAKKIAPHDIILYGHSLGGAVAIEIAHRHPDAGGLISESTFTSLHDMANKDPVFRYFPITLILNQKMGSEEKMRSIHMPVLVIHGTADYMIPSTMAEKLYAAANQPKSIFLVPRAGHEDVAETAGAEYAKHIFEFWKVPPPAH